MKEIFYKSLSYKESDLSLEDFKCIVSFISKIKQLNSLVNKYEFDKKLFIRIMKRRIRIIYLKNYNLGFGLFNSYFQLYLCGVFPNLDFVYFQKILLYNLRYYR